MLEPSANSVVVQDQLSGSPRWLLFQNPDAVISTANLSEVWDCLQEVDAGTARGRYAAGFVSYEASAALDSAFETHLPKNMPLIWFGIYDRYEVLNLPTSDAQAFPLDNWRPSVTQSDYREALARIKGSIGQGDTYQVNYSFRMHSAFGGNPWLLFLELNKAQRGAYSAYINLGRQHICSVSPELFFSLKDGELTCKPMKGTAKRGYTSADDRSREQWLASSQKNQSENVMIVDMARNDMGRLAEPGSVRVEKLFTIEKYPTVLQMTSTVTARTRASACDILYAMFPCASITGAPKVKSMQIIKQLEPGPRGVYTGSIGYIFPQGLSQFNVAIRTAVIDLETSTVEYGVGGGITSESDPDDEYEECQTKARVLLDRFPEFKLIETILWSAGCGFYLLDHHLERLRDSAAYFQFKLPMDELHAGLEKAALEADSKNKRVRIALSRCGKLEVQISDLVSIAGCKVALAWRPLSQQSPFLHHKTTYREHYLRLLEEHRKDQPDLADLIFWNEAGFITESSIANVVVGMGGELFTPPLAQGLLPGVFRRCLVQQGIVKEKDIRIDDLRNAQWVFLVNSLREWMPLDWSTSENLWNIRSDLSLDTPRPW